MPHLEYEPRDPFIPFHHREERFGILVCHRRAGKTVACIGDLIHKAITIDHKEKPNARFAYIGPFRQQAKETAWEYLKQYSAPIRLGPPRESELRVKFPNGASITVYGADNPDTFRGLYFDGVIIDEFGDCRPTLWNQVILPALLDRNGWAVFIGTVKGKNHFYSMWTRALKETKDWFSLMLKVSESGLLSEEAVSAARREMSEEEFNQEMECDWEAAVPGTYYAKTISEMGDRLGSYPYKPDLPVYAAADIGYSDSTAWWFWQVDEQGPFLIDYEEDAGRPLNFYFDMLEDKPYPIEKVYLPHDAKATSFQTGRTTVEQFLARKIRCEIVPRQKVQHGIDAARLLLRSCRINEPECYAGVEALRAYRRQFNQKTQQYSDKPLHDWASNGADAFRYFALVTQDEVMESEPEPEVTFEGFTLDQLWEDRENDNWRNSILRI